MAADIRDKIPLLLLKTRSTPADGYEEYFSSFDNCNYAPVFVPVLEHRFKQAALDRVRDHVTKRAFMPGPAQDLDKYGAMIFTSQRAVEAFANIVENIRSEGTTLLDEHLPETLPLYAVGPATARGLRALNLKCPILGEETGNGEALSAFILEHYNSIHRATANPPILFLVGEKRRDIIPNSLQSEQLPQGQRSRVDEIEVYETGELLSFKTSFSSLWQKHQDSGAKQQWVVVFSPTGCKAMLESLGLLDEQTGKARQNTVPRNIRIVTIGPTTYDYLANEFGFKADVCAERPSPEGIGSAIKAYTGPAQ